MINSPWIRKPDFPATSMAHYDEYWAHRGWEINVKLKEREKVILELIPAGSKVLDIGCGNSRLPVALKEKGVDITVADVSAEVLTGYDQYNIPGHTMDLENIETIDLEGEQYDYIIMSEVLEHIKNSEEVIATLKGNTKQFLLTIPNSAAYQFRYGLMFRGRFFTQWVYHPAEHVRFWSHIDFIDWLQAQGLQVDDTKVTDGFTLRGVLPRLPNLWKNLLAYRVLYICSGSAN